VTALIVDARLSAPDIVAGAGARASIAFLNSFEDQEPPHTRRAYAHAARSGDQGFHDQRGTGRRPARQSEAARGRKLSPRPARSSVAALECHRRGESDQKAQGRISVSWRIRHKPAKNRRMRRDYLIAIMLAVSAFPMGAALMVAPGYLNLSGSAIPLTFWGGIGLTLALICAAAIVALRGEARTIQEASMTTGEIGYNVALVAVAASFVAALKHAPRSAWFACAIALLGFGIDYWTGPPRVFIWSHRSFTGSDLLRAGLNGSPMGWSQLYINDTALGAAAKPMNITELTLFGGNVSDKEITLDDAYFLSGIDSTRLDAKIGWGGTQYKIQEIKPIPAGAFVFIMSEPIGPPNVGLSQADFIDKWATVIFIAKYNGITQRVSFDREAVKSAIPKPSEPFPHISPLQER
jgi:hypothetical protein